MNPSTNSCNAVNCSLPIYLYFIIYSVSLIVISLSLLSSRSNTNESINIFFFLYLITFLILTSGVPPSITFFIKVFILFFTKNVISSSAVFLIFFTFVLYWYSIIGILKSLSNKKINFFYINYNTLYRNIIILIILFTIIFNISIITDIFLYAYVVLVCH